MNAEEKAIQRTIWREQDSEEILARPEVKKLLADFKLTMHAPMAQRGFNEWNYWHAMKYDLGLFPLSPARLLEDAEVYSKHQAIPIYCRPMK